MRKEVKETSKFYVIIPQDRIGALIGPEGQVKKRIESEAQVALLIDSESGDVVITANSNSTDPFLAIKARDIVQAIARGFNPQIALSLVDEDTYLEIINIKTIEGDNPNKIKRIKGRIIGREGRAREIIEEATGTQVSVYGNTVAIIGLYERLRVAKTAIDMILTGAKHGTVYAFLEEEARKFKLSERELWQKASRDKK